MSVNDVRQEIDEIDDAVFLLLDKRMECSRKMAKEKVINSAMVFDGKREDEILQRIERSVSPQNADSVKRVYERVFDESKKVQNAFLNQDGRQ